MASDLSDLLVSAYIPDCPKCLNLSRCWPKNTIHFLVDCGPTLVCVYVPRLEALLGPSEQRVCELSKDLARSEQQLGQLQAHSQTQAQQLQHLEDTCTQLSSVREMNEVSHLELSVRHTIGSTGVFYMLLQN